MLYLFEDYALDADRRELLKADRPIAVQPQVFDLLEYLIRNRGHVVSRDDLLGRYLGRAHRLRINARHPHQRGPQRDR